MSWKLRLAWVATALALCGAGWWGVQQWRLAVVERQRERAFVAVNHLMDNGRWLEARGALREFWQNYGANMPAAEAGRWRQLDVTLSRRAGDLARLVWLHDVAPERVLADEAASLLLVRTYQASGQDELADAVVTEWRGREENPGRWMAVLADRLMAQGRSAEARTLLESRSFADDQEVGRRLRLALLSPTPAAAWEQLKQAMAENPRNADLRSLRAQVLERAGAVEQARVEYVAAVVADPVDVVRRDQLAEFYRRHGGGAPAARTWWDGLTPTAPDFLWLRIGLWSRLWGELEESVAPPPAPPGRWTDLIAHLAAIPPDHFWVDIKSANPAQARGMETRPEVAWLRLLEQLRRGDEAGAAETLSARERELSRWHAILAEALRAVVRWRATGLAPGDGYLPVSAPGVVEHVLIEQLRQWPGRGLPEETANLLRGDGAWTALMLAAGWPRAALTMAGAQLVEPDVMAPGWVHYGLLVSLGRGGNSAAARAFAERVPQTPEMRLWLAESDWGQPATAERGTNALAALTREAGAVGLRATWLLATAAAERGDRAAARDWVGSRADLAAAPEGRVLVARLALGDGQEEAAARIYAEVGTASLEAGMFLAKRAFAAGDWVEARSLTLELLANFPEEIELRANLQRIDDAARAAGGEGTP